MTYHIYTDGGVRGNGKEENLGSFAIVITKGSVYQIGEMSRCCKNTTNNIMELEGILLALKFISLMNIKNPQEQYHIYSDSMYSINTITDWMWKWESQQWTKKGGEIKNLELIKKIHTLIQKHDLLPIVQFHHVKGHSGNKFNEIVDGVVNQAMDNYMKKRSESYE